MSALLNQVRGGVWIKDFIGAVHPRWKKRGNTAWILINAISSKVIFRLT